MSPVSLQFIRLRHTARGWVPVVATFPIATFPSDGGCGLSSPDIAWESDGRALAWKRPHHRPLEAAHRHAHIWRVTAPPKSIHLGSDVSLDVAGLTDVGRERRRNEDQFLIARLERNLHVEATSVKEAEGLLPGSTEGTVMLVADGMGGTAAGDLASSVAVKAIAGYVCNVLPWADARNRTDAESEPPPQRKTEPTIPGMRVGLSNALVEGDAEVRRAADTHGKKGMGTTLTLGYLQWPQLYVAHAGDSRCYLLRGARLSQLTTDHTLAEKLRAQAAHLEIDDSSPWHHVLWNALGGGEHASIEPEVHRLQLTPGDTLLLCSDGLTKHVSDAEITATLRSATDATHACAVLVHKALEGGGSDNVTVVVARSRRRQDPYDGDEPTRVRKPDPMEETLPMGPDFSIDSDRPTIRRKPK